MLRWLLPVIAAIAVLGSSVMTWAAAGMVGEIECCCPVKAKCKCHDHGKDTGPTPVMKNCGGSGELVTPAPEATVLAAPLEVVTVRRAARTEPAPPPIAPADRAIEPETPPF